MYASDIFFICLKSVCNKCFLFYYYSRSFNFMKSTSNISKKKFAQFFMYLFNSVWIQLGLIRCMRIIVLNIYVRSSLNYFEVVYVLTLRCITLCFLLCYNIIHSLFQYISVYTHIIHQRYILFIWDSFIVFHPLEIFVYRGKVKIFNTNKFSKHTYMYSLYLNII